jgi:hypothetical protein
MACSLPFFNAGVGINVEAMFKIGIAFEVEQLACRFAETYALLFFFLGLVHAWTYVRNFVLAESLRGSKASAGFFVLLRFIWELMVEAGSWCKFSSAFGNHFDQFQRGDELRVHHADDFSSPLVCLLYLFFDIAQGASVEFLHSGVILSDRFKRTRFLLFLR